MTNTGTKTGQKQDRKSRDNALCENPETIEYVTYLKPGTVFTLFGVEYARQDTYKLGDTVLFIHHTQRMYLHPDGRFIIVDGEILSRKVTKLSYATLREEPTVQVWAADHSDCSLMMRRDIEASPPESDTLCFVPVGIKV